VAKPKLDGVLGSVPIFDGLSKRQLRQVAAVSELADYMAGHSIVREGEIGDTFFIVLRGQAKVTVKGRTIHRALPGDHFGEISLLDGGPRTATVTSETPMTLVSISRKSFLRAIEKDPQISFAMMGTMARMIRPVDRSLAG